MMRGIKVIEELLSKRIKPCLDQSGFIIMFSLIKVIAVSGTHGKTTTSSLITSYLKNLAIKSKLSNRRNANWF
ncbi:MAG: hypothetical protein CM15mP69_6100 [Ectothiorhodospiraceae bacterium]|nr:MAG: hypothetical protein CM15mP69_6100 [Ectothiorhodospiraceae bacterium]